jgi:glucose/arabinose dehydrogenase
LEYRQQTLALGRTSVTVTVPAGYTLELLNANLDTPRLLTFAKNGDLFVGSRSKVYRLPPPYTRAESFVELNDYPHSVAFRPGEILIAQTSGLYRAPYEPGQRQLSRQDVTLLAPLPGGGGHSSRTVAIGPDGRVYLSLGMSGNCSNQYLGQNYPFRDRRGGVLVLREEGGKAEWEIYASGLRNPIGLDWHPETRVLYASNNGPDHWGYELPPEYFSRLEPGSFHGMPWFQFNGQRVRRDNCIRATPPRPAGQVVKPVATFPARSAPMGVAFVLKGAMDERFSGDAVVALHGSWATQPTGGPFGHPATRRAPKLVVVRFGNGEARRVDDLVTGFQLKDGSRWARPVGVAIGPDGALYFTSDSGIIPNAAEIDRFLSRL